MRILGIDLGDVRTGVAVTDSLQLTAQPLTTISQTDKKKLAKEIAKIAKDNDAKMCIVGLPKNMDGSEGDRAKTSRAFASELEKLGLEIEFVDERLTTVSAASYLNNCNVRGEERKKIIDTVSAVIILESFLYRRNKNG